MKSRSLTRSAFWLLTAIVLFFALVPGKLGTIIPSDTERHYLAFLVLPALAHYAWPRLSPLLLWLAFAAFGAMIELLQFEMNLGRAAEMHDWINDMSAAAISLAVSFAVLRLVERGETA